MSWVGSDSAGFFVNTELGRTTAEGRLERGFRGARPKLGQREPLSVLASLHGSPCWAWASVTALLASAVQALSPRRSVPRSIHSFQAHCRSLSACPGTRKLICIPTRYWGARDSADAFGAVHTGIPHKLLFL